MRRTLLLLVAVWGLSAKPASALPGYRAPVYALDAGLPVHPLDSFVDVLADSAGRLNVTDVRNMPNAAWRPLREVSVPYGKRYRGGHLPLGPRAYFLRLRLRAEVPLEGWEFHLEDRLHHNVAWIRGNGRVDVWAFRDGVLRWHRVTGADVPQHERDVPGRRTLDRVRANGLGGGRVDELLLRVAGNSLGFPAFANASLRAPGYGDYHPLFSVPSRFNAFVFGATAILLLTNLLLFAYLRQRVYFYFALWLGFCALTHAMTVGVEPADYLPFDHPRLRALIWIAVPNAMLFTFWLFGRAFVGTPVRYPRLDRAMLLLPVAMGLVIVTQGARVLLFDAPRPFTALSGLYEAIGSFAVAGLVLGGVLVTRRGDRLAQYFGVGAVVASGSLIVAGLWAVRIIRLGFDPFAASTLLQVVVYSFGMAYRQRQRADRAQTAALEAERARGEVARMRDLDEVKARFFANVSHEFRTPLALISGPLAQAEQRARRAFGADAATVPLRREEYAAISDSAGRLRGLVDQLLELSRLEHGAVTLALQRGGVVPHLRRVVASFESLAERAGVSLQTHFPRPCPEAYFDGDKLTKIVSNLVTNAVAYTPEQGSVTVAIDCDGTALTVAVGDTGPGIAPEERDRIFERFYRVEGTEVVGTGIGLALTKELVVLHGGTIAVESVLGQGSTFRVRLPCRRADLPADARLVALTVAGEGPLAGSASREGPPADARAPSGQTASDSDAPGPTALLPTADERETVLVVEDNRRLRDFVAGILGERYRVLTAADGRQGERMATEHVPDLVLSDVMMPGQDGYALCHAIKRNPKTCHLPVVLLTAKAGPEATRTGLSQGADGYLVKPFDAEELLLRIGNLLALRRRLWTRFRELDLTLLPEVDARSLDDQFVQAVAAYVTEHLGDSQLSVDALAGAVGYSRSQLSRKLKALTGKTPRQLIAEMRLREAHRQLERGQGTVSEVAYRVGYANLSYFGKAFRKLHGYTPSAVDTVGAE